MKDHKNALASPNNSISIDGNVCPKNIGIASLKKRPSTSHCLKNLIIAQAYRVFIFGSAL